METPAPAAEPRRPNEGEIIVLEQPQQKFNKCLCLGVITFRPHSDIEVNQRADPPGYEDGGQRPPEPKLQGCSVGLLSAPQEYPRPDGWLPSVPLPTIIAGTVSRTREVVVLVVVKITAVVVGIAL